MEAMDPLFPKQAYNHKNVNAISEVHRISHLWRTKEPRTKNQKLTTLTYFYRYIYKTVNKFKIEKAYILFVKGL